MEPCSHYISKQETGQIKSLGYAFHGGADHPDEFLNEHFPNFDLHKLLLQLEGLLCSLCRKEIYRQLMIENRPPTFILEIVSAELENEDESIGLARTFTKEDTLLTVSNDFIQLPVKYRNQGIGKQIYKVLFQQYLNIGIGKCYIYACKSGGLVWGKMHFTARFQAEMKEILETARPKLTERQFNAIERIYHNYYSKNPRGQDFPINKWAELPFMENILKNSNWHGALNLQNKQQLAKFMSYVS